MKLKLVALSMSVLGLISNSAFAVTQQTTTKTTTTAVTTKEHPRYDYKDMGMIETCPINDPTTILLDTMHQNLGRAKPTEGCHKLISLAGGAAFTAAWGNRSMGYQGENYQRASLNDVYLNIFGNVNEWVKAFASASYSNTTSNNNTPTTGSTTTLNNGQYSNVYDNNSLNLEQGFIRVANFDQFPLYLQVGKQFQDFGRYRIHPITRSMTQVMTETLQTSAEVGFVTESGLNGAISAFDTPLRPRYTTAATSYKGHTDTDFTVALDFTHLSDQLGFDIGAEYLYNMTGVGDINQALSQYQSGYTSNSGGTYYNNVSAAAVHGDVNTGPFSLNLRYVSALQRFNNNDLSTQTLSVAPIGTGKGAKPSAGDVQAGFNFNGWNKNQNLYVGYQASADAVNIFLPQKRWLAGYNIDAWKNTNVGVELGHDIDYNTSHGGTGKSTNTIGLRGAVIFG
jgi:hypothetical protein